MSIRFFKVVFDYLAQREHTLNTRIIKPDLGQRVPEPPGSPAEQNRLQLPGRLLLHPRHHMPVSVERERHFGVAESLTNNLGILTRSKKKRRTCMSAVIPPEAPWQT